MPRRRVGSRIRRAKNTFTADVERTINNGLAGDLNADVPTLIHLGLKFSRHPFSADLVTDNFLSGAADDRTDTLYLAALPGQSLPDPAIRAGDVIIKQVGGLRLQVTGTVVNLGNGDSTISIPVRDLVYTNI